MTVPTQPLAPSTVYTGGTFDLLHAGHVHLLAQCRKLAGPGGRVVVALNTDEFVASYKDKPPVCTYAERAAVLRACRYVDAVVENIGGADSKPAIAQVAPQWIAIGEDWATRDYYAQMGFTSEWLADRDISLVYLPHALGLSSSAIKARVRQR